MKKAELVDLIAGYAIGYLNYDDEHPEVGMGMHYETAIDLAIKAVLAEGERWGKKVVITEKMEQAALQIVRDKRTPYGR